METSLLPHQWMTNMILVIFHWGWRQGQLCWVTSSRASTCWCHLFLTLNYDNFLNYLLVSMLSLLVFRKVTFTWHRNATSIQAVQWVIVLVSFWRSGGSLLTAGTLLIAGLVYCEGQHGCPPPSYFSLAVKRDNSLPNRLVLFIKGFSLIGGSLGLVGCEYRHDKHTAVWGWKNNWLYTTTAR